MHPTPGGLQAEVCTIICFGAPYCHCLWFNANAGRTTEEWFPFGFYYYFCFGLEFMNSRFRGDLLPLCRFVFFVDHHFSVLAHHFFELELSVVTQSFVHSRIQCEYGFWCHVNNRQFVKPKTLFDENGSLFFILSLYLSVENNWFNFNLYGISFVLSSFLHRLAPIDQRIRFIR